MIPQWLAWLFVVAGVFLAGYLAYHDLYVTSERAKGSAVIVRHPVYRRADSRQSGVLYEIAETMRRVHGHADEEALERDYLDGMLASDLLRQQCTVCGDGTLRNEPKE